VLGSGFLVRRIGEDVAGDQRVLAGGCLGDAEYQGEVQQVGPGGQRFVEDTVAADALDADAVSLQVLVEVTVAGGLIAEGGARRDQDVLVGRVRPGGVAVVGSGLQRLGAGGVGAPWGAGGGDAVAGQVQVVEGEITDCLSSGGVDRSQGDDQPLRGIGNCLRGGSDFGIVHRQQAGS